MISNPPPSVAGRDGVKHLVLSLEKHKRYKRLADRTANLNLVDRFDIPAREGRSFQVSTRSVLRIACHEGPQVGDMINFY